MNNVIFSFAIFGALKSIAVGVIFCYAMSRLKELTNKLCSDEERNSKIFEDFKDHNTVVAAAATAVIIIVFEDAIESYYQYFYVDMYQSYYDFLAVLKALLFCLKAAVAVFAAFKQYISQIILYLKDKEKRDRRMVFCVVIYTPVLCMGISHLMRAIAILNQSITGELKTECFQVEFINQGYEKVRSDCIFRINRTIKPNPHPPPPVLTSIY